MYFIFIVVFGLCCRPEEVWRRNILILRYIAKDKENMTERTENDYWHGY